MKPAPLNQNAILAALRGQTLLIPSLTPLFRHWPSTAAAAQPNPHYRSAIPLVDQAIDRIAATHPLIAKRKGDDIALLTALWYPTAEQRVLQNLALYAVWLVCWDDCVDAGEGVLAGDLEAAEGWRERTGDIVMRSLGIKGVEEEGQVDAVNAIFQDFGDGFRSSPTAQRARLYDEVQYFIKCCGTEQKLRLENYIPDYSSYMSFRLGTVGGRMLCSLVEYAISEELPAPAIYSPSRDKLWNQVCVLLSLMNDALSLKKELASDCVINAVTALLAPEKGLGAVMRELWDKLGEAVQEFDRAADALLELVKGDEKGTSAVRRHVDGCRAIVIGTLEFT